jgi:hypothetical protein
VGCDGIHEESERFLKADIAGKFFRRVVEQARGLRGE